VGVRIWVVRIWVVRIWNAGHVYRKTQRSNFCQRTPGASLFFYAKVGGISFPVIYFAFCCLYLVTFSSKHTSKNLQAVYPGWSVFIWVLFVALSNAEFIHLFIEPNPD
jgi:hypothetical protein